MQELFIGVDIGGTRTKSGLVNIDTGEVLHSIVQPTEKKKAAVFTEAIGDTIRACKGIAAEKGKTIAGIIARFKMVLQIKKEPPRKMLFRIDTE